MRFISNGDFGFPFQFIEYFSKHFYTWSFQSGTPNLDGIIRFFSRLPVLAFFYVTNSGEAAAYFYIVLCVVAAFLSFNYFLKGFYDVQSWKYRIIPSLFFTFNPIFLGNFAKIGLNLAVAMLPLVLVCLKKYFDKGRFEYLILVLLLLNVSLIHPYTFVVNTGVATVYFFFRIIAAKKLTLRLVRHIVIAQIIALLLNVYFMIPIAQVGTINKDAIINTASQQSIATDYSALISIANTETIFTAFSLSKNVLKDFEYYNEHYSIIYFVSVFLFYVLLLFLISSQYKNYSGVTKFRLAITFILLLILLLLSTGVFLNIDKLLIFLSSLPGGWAFRSPLKWQLYIPIALGSVLAIALAKLRSKKAFLSYVLLFSILLILVNGYLAKDIFTKLLTPRRISRFQDFPATQLDGKRLLFIRNIDCPIFENDLQDSVELNQLVQSHPVQVKTTEFNNYKSVFLNTFDYIMTCDERSYFFPENFYLAYKNNDNLVKVYQNKTAKAMVYMASGTSLVDGTPKDFSYLADTSNAAYIFSNSDPGLINKSIKIIDGVEANVLRPENLSVNPGEISSHLNPGFLKTGQSKIDIDSSSGDSSYTLSQDLLMSQGLITLHSDKISGDNLYANGDFETNSTIDLGDCYNYDSTSLNDNDISYSFVPEAAVGRRALYLQAGRHLGCLAFPVGSLNKNSDYLVSFKYKQLSGEQSQFVVYSNDPKIDGQRTTLPTVADKSWQTYTQILSAGTIIPETKIYLYLPTNELDLTSVLLDDFKITEIPHLPSVYLHSTKNPLSSPELDFKRVNDTKYVVEVNNLSENRLLVFSDSYSPQWNAFVESTELKPTNNSGYKVSASNHFLINGSANGWMIDLTALPDNIRNSGNSYRIIIEFAPQRSFYLGLLISGITLVGCISYLVWARKKDRKKKKELIIAPPWPSK